MTNEEKFEEWYKANSEEYDVTKATCRAIWLTAFSQGREEGLNEGWANGFEEAHKVL